MARPRKEIDWEQFDKLCALHCVISEFACYFDCHEDTIEAAVQREKDMSFPAYFKLKSGTGKTSLRKKMYSTAMNGNVTMQIFIAKNWLKMGDRLTHLTEDEDGKPKPVNGFHFIDPDNVESARIQTTPPSDEVS